MHTGWRWSAAITAANSTVSELEEGHRFCKAWTDLESRMAVAERDRDAKKNKQLFFARRHVLNNKKWLGLGWGGGGRVCRLWLVLGTWPYLD